MTSQIRRRVPWVDVAKAFSILLVVLVHVCIEFNFIGINSRWIDNAMPIMGTIRMPLFFAASGLFAVAWTTRRSWSDLLNRKVALLVWVFLIWQPVVLAYKLAEMWWLPNQPDNTVQTQVAKIILSPLRPNGELWFLWALALFFVLARLTRNLPTIVKVGVPAAISIGWIYASTNILSDDTLRLLGNGINGALSYYVFFIAAVVFSKPIQDWFSQLHPAAAIGLFAAWVAGGVAIEMADVDFLGLGFAIRLLAVAAGFALATLFVRVRPLAWLGANTLQVYVAHIVFIVAATIGLYHLGVADALAKVPEVSIAAMLIIATMLSIGLHKLAMRVPLGRLLYQQPAWLRIGKPSGEERRADRDGVDPETARGGADRSGAQR